MNQHTSLNDEKLFQLCQSYGEQARIWKQKFAGLIPEVFRRKLYIKKGFGSIFEFAAKLGGMSEENEIFWANQVRQLPHRALETLVRDIRTEENKALHVQRHSTQKDTQDKIPLELQLTAEIKQKLLELQQKGIDINKLLQNFLDQREEKIKNEKEEISKAVNQKNEYPLKISRYIPAKIKKLITQEYGSKCSIPLCLKPAKVIHHTQRFALTQSHDPYYLAPLCQEHHTIAHSIDVQFKEKRLGARHLT